jgi:signal transduction histidine kinase/DNA-binding response OmpR family regulator
MHLFKKIYKVKLHPIYFTIGLSVFLCLLTNVLIAQPKAQKGVIDLKEYDFNNEEAVPLDGEWEFYWGKLLTGTEFSDQEPNVEDFLLNWDTKYSSFGFATYRLLILLPEEPSNYALQIPIFYSSYKLFANGSLIASNGSVGTSKEQSVPKWIPRNTSFETSDTASVELVIHVSNFNHSRGGAYQPILVGKSEVISKKREVELALTYLLTGVLLITSFFFLGLYLFGKKEKAILFFSIFCFTYSYRIIGLGLYPLNFLFPELPWILTLKLEYITLFLSGLLFGIYTLYLYPRETSQLLIKVFSYLSLAFVIPAMILPAYWFTQLVLPYFIILIAYIFYAFWVYLKAFLNKREGAGFALASTGIVFLVFLYEMMVYFGFLDEIVIYNFLGYLFFFSFQSLVLTYRFSNSLKRATQRAEEASRAKSQFLSTMSHEIRTPLNAIIGLSGLLAETPLNKTQEDYVKTVKISGENLLSIINNILDYSKIESSKIEINRSEVGVQELVENVLDLVAPLNINANVELVYDIDDSVPPFIITDQVKLQQILINLINNAVKFTEKGEIFVQLKMLNNSNQETEKLHISIRDTGIGISEKGLRKLFQSFSQVDGTSTRKYGGTGLGLVISKRLIEAMGGSISVESVVNEGTEFSFSINIQKSDRDLEPYKSEILKGKKALVIDDNLTNLKIFSHQGELQGLKVETTSDPEFVIENLSTLNEYDFIVLDMQMPKKDGVEVAKEIRAKWDHSSLPLVMLSSIHALESKTDYELFDLQLTKPVKQSQLFRTLETLFTHKKNSNSNSKPNEIKKTEFSDKRILVAEDNLFNQKVSEKILERLGFKPLIVENGKAALDEIMTNPYDIVFMDVEMPIMDGLEATKTLKASKSELAKMPVIIAMTANALADDKQRCLDAGMDDFITKPVTIDTLNKVIKKWI